MIVCDGMGWDRIRREETDFRWLNSSGQLQSRKGAGFRFLNPESPAPTQRSKCLGSFQSNYKSNPHTIDGMGMGIGMGMVIGGVVWGGVMWCGVG